MSCLYRLLSLFAVLATGGCSWVTLEKGADGVLVLPAERITADCKSLGTVTVSVLDKVGVLERHDEEVVEDLHVLARNHAASQGGDTVVPQGEVKDGSRGYAVYRCMSGTAVPKSANQKEKNNEVEVLPYEGGD